MDDVTFRELGPDDVTDLHAVASGWEVVRQLGGWPWPPDPAFTATRSKPYAGRGFVWGIEAGGRVIGSVAVTRGELGYMLHRDYWGRGIGRRAVAAALRQGFADPDAQVLRASVWADNRASAGLLRRFGFVHWQTRFEHARARGYPVASHHYRLTRAARDDLRTGAQ